MAGGRHGALLHLRETEVRMGHYRSLSSYQQALYKRGYEYVASGMFATIFAKPQSSTVLKVGTMTDVYPIYLQWAVDKGYAGTFAPRVKSFKVHTTNDDEPFYVAEIERLATTVEEADDDDYAKAVELFYDLRGSSSGFHSLKDLKNLAPDWVPFVDGLTKLKNRHSLTFDLHDQNFMVRNNGDLVLIDPMFDGDPFGGTRPRTIKTTRDAAVKLATKFKH